MQANRDDCRLCKQFDTPNVCKIDKELTICGYCLSFENKVIRRTMLGDNE